MVFPNWSVNNLKLRQSEKFLRRFWEIISRCLKTGASNLKDHKATCQVRFYITVTFFSQFLSSPDGAKNVRFGQIFNCLRVGTIGVNTTKWRRSNKGVNYAALKTSRYLERVTVRKGLKNRPVQTNKPRVETKPQSCNGDVLNQVK